jgi:UDP-glucose 4-epimerase
MDLIDAHIRALDYLLDGGATDIFNLGSGKGFSVAEIVDTARKSLNRPHFAPAIAARRAGDPAFLIASNAKAGRILGWQPARALADIIGDAAAWHRTPRYRDAMRAAAGKSADIAL